MNNAVERYAAAFEAQKATLCGGNIPWVSGTREKAIESFERQGFPAARDEDWKYTRISPIEKQTYTPTITSKDAIDHDELQSRRIGALSGHRLVFVDGFFSQSHSDIGSLPDGVTIKPMHLVLEQGAESTRAHLARYADIDQNAFCALNTAFMNNGAVIELAPNVILDAPVILEFVASACEAFVATHPRVLVVAGASANVHVIEHYIGLGDEPYLTNAVSEIALDQNAAVTHYKLQEESAKALHIASLNVQQHADAQFVSHSISLGAQLARNDIFASLTQPGASCDLYGLYLARQRQHVDYHTRIDHRAAHCDSKEIYKGVIDERGRGVFNGRVYVHPDAQKTNAEQSNDNLLLSPHAEVDTKPQLEIFADDVKCAHGATVGQLDEDMIFYLRARGISETAARGLLTYGFAAEVVNEIKLGALHDHLAKRLVDWLPSADQIRDIVT